MYKVYEVWKFVLVAHFVLVCCAGDLASVAILLITFFIDIAAFAWFSYKYVWMGG
jgi:hypothetical protein